MKRNEKINKRIKDLGYKKVFIAEKFGMSKHTLSYYLNGQRNMPEEKILMIESFLGL